MKSFEAIVRALGLLSEQKAYRKRLIGKSVKVGVTLWSYTVETNNLLKIDCGAEDAGITRQEAISNRDDGNLDMVVEVTKSG